MLLPDLDSISKIVGLGGGLIGAIGGLIGIITAVKSQRREKWKEIEQDNDYSFLAAFMTKQVKVGEHAGSIAVHMEIGTDEWKRAEKLVERNILVREPINEARRVVTGDQSKNVMGYRLRGLYEDKKKPVKWS